MTNEIPCCLLHIRPAIYSQRERCNMKLASIRQCCTRHHSKTTPRRSDHKTALATPNGLLPLHLASEGLHAWSQHQHDDQFPNFQAMSFRSEERRGGRFETPCPSATAAKPKDSTIAGMKEHARNEHRETFIEIVGPEDVGLIAHHAPLPARFQGKLVWRRAQSSALTTVSSRFMLCYVVIETCTCS